jgi:hypothetical protein
VGIRAVLWRGEEELVEGTIFIGGEDSTEECFNGLPGRWGL